MEDKNTESEPSKTFQLLYVGFNRSINHVYPSVRTNVVESCSGQGYKVKVSAVISTADKIVESNRGAREFARVQRDLPAALISDAEELILLDEESVNEEIQETFEKVKRFGDPWPETNFKSLFNLVHLLYLQKESARLIDVDSKITMYLRPDLLASDKLDLVRLEKYGVNQLITPSWHHWGYLNDRVAIAKPWVMRRYLSRWDLIFDYLSKVREPLHAEKFLSYAMKTTPTAQVITEKFSRVRANGIILEENYTPEGQTFWVV
jgi:hypothetical protein